jgi:hypothetical protein
MQVLAVAGFLTCAVHLALKGRLKNEARQMWEGCGYFAVAKERFSISI